MKSHRNELLDKAIYAIRAQEPDTDSIIASARRVSDRLGIAMGPAAVAGAIESCVDVQQLLDAYRDGTLSEARSLLVKAHLQDCGICLRRFREGSASTAVDWSAPGAARRRDWRPQVWAWGLAASFVLMLSALFVYKAYWAVPPGVRAEVQSIDGSAYLISNTGDRRVMPGATLQEGEHLRTNGGSRAILRLSDGSQVEVNERSALGVGARGRDMTVSLDQGDVIVQAAKRSSGHLYVETPDCRVAVTGTVFSVNSGIKGSRVAVLQGSVQVIHAGIHSLLHPGDQITTNDNLNPAPLEQQFAWSPDRQKYLGILAQLSIVEHRIGQIPFPQPRYSSDLLPRVPDATLLYVSIPNLGDFLSQANSIFQDQLKQSPALQQWWSQGKGHNTDDLNTLIEKLHDVSQYLGDEVVIAGIKQVDRPAVAVLADVKKSGLEDELQRQFSGTAHGFVVLNEKSLAATSAAEPARANNGPGGYALVRDHEVLFSNSVSTLKQLDAQLNAGASGFAAGDFGKQISAAYDRGAGIILAADLHQMMAGGFQRAHQNPARQAMAQNSGMEGLSYLIAEHREMNGVPENHLNLQFSGTRQRIASWLGSPAPMGSLEFVTPNAAVAVAMLSKDPAAIADDMMTMTSAGGAKADWSEADAKLQISIRDDLMANLGGDFLVALDGPVLPTPSWKAVIEVNDAGRLESTLERLAQSVNNQVKGSKGHAVAIEPSEVGGQRFYAIHDLTSGNIFAHYTFSRGFMIIAPSRALLIEALQTNASGNSLARSPSFRALLPKDDNANYSAVAYQNLGPVLTPLLSQFSGESADAIRKLAADSRPTAMCAWGKENRIEAASDSRLFGFDFLTLGTLLDSRNKLAGQHVSE